MSRTDSDCIDAVVVGSGIAGLCAALALEADGARVCILTKDRMTESNSWHAQGGIAASIDSGDSPRQHERDTLAAGSGLNDEAAVSVLTEEAAECIDQLLELGVNFDREADKLALTREGGHHRSRVLHAGGDATGLHLQSALLRSVRTRSLQLREHMTVTSLLVESGRVIGVQAIDSRQQQTVKIMAERTVLATGGAGQMYSRTTNPRVATADGVAAAYRAGAQLTDLEFFQFHPTALAVEGSPPFLVSEAARGEGGVLRDIWGRPFMDRYHQDRDLAPRDVVSRAIWREMQTAGSNHVYLDLTGHSKTELRRRFPTIWLKCLETGIDISEDWIPVAPAAHYFMGGIRSDLDGRTSLPGLYVAGEAAATGVHGANRLASNSLLEGAVFGKRTGRADDSPATFLTEGAVGHALTHPEILAAPESLDMPGTEDLQRLNWNEIGIVRRGERLIEHLARLHSWKLEGGLPSREAAELSNMLLVSRLMTEAAALRTESRGAHYRTDFPDTDASWQGHIVFAGSQRTFVPAESRVSEAVSA